MRPKDDLAYLWDIHEEARLIMDFVKAVPHIKFVETRLVRYAVERSLILIGDAAGHVSQEFQEAHPEIAWQEMIGQRNILSREYGDIKVDRIWAAATVNIPMLLERLQTLLPD
jgi:uncharacterized protein with HEPN domain